MKIACFCLKWSRIAPLVTKDEGHVHQFTWNIQESFSAY